MNLIDYYNQHQDLIVDPTVDQIVAALSPEKPYLPLRGFKGSVSGTMPRVPMPAIKDKHIPVPERKPEIPVPIPQRKPPYIEPGFNMEPDGYVPPQYANGGVPVANSFVPPVSANAQSFATRPAPALPAGLITPPPPQPFSGLVGNVPMSAMMGGEGSNGIVAQVNGMGIPSGSPSVPTTPNNAPPSLPATPPPDPTSDPGQTLASNAAIPGQSGLYGVQNGQYMPLNFGTTQQTGIPDNFSSGYGITSLPTGFSAYTGGISPQLYTGPTYSFSGSGQPTLLGGGEHMAAGGGPRLETAPWYMKREASSSVYHPQGLFKGVTGGRTDVLNRAVPAGSYVIPADVVSGLGEGNTMAGANVLDKMMHTLPFGIKGGKGAGGIGMPSSKAGHFIGGGEVGGEYYERQETYGMRPMPSSHSEYIMRGLRDDPSAGGAPRQNNTSTLTGTQRAPTGGDLTSDQMGAIAKHGVSNNPVTPNIGYRQPTRLPRSANERSQGGAPQDQGTEDVPIVAASGEYLIHPDYVKAIGHGDMKHGHEILDHMVIHIRKKTVEKTRKLPPPKGSRK